MALPVGTGWMTNGEEQDGEQPAHDPNTDPEILKLTDEINSRRWNQPAPPVSSDISGEPDGGPNSGRNFSAIRKTRHIDFHNDPKHSMPCSRRRPELPWHQDLSHPQFGAALGI